MRKPLHSAGTPSSKVEAAATPVRSSVPSSSSGRKKRFYLNSYQPLVMNRAGRAAIGLHGISPFVDHSCRREPDFESSYPSITALCRPPFARKLQEGDTVVYITKKGDYLGAQEGHWRLTAALEVIKRFESHEKAARWYLDEDLRLPYNCMVRSNPPLLLDRTAATWPLLEEWNGEYVKRASLDAVFLVCKPIFIELVTPPAITVNTMTQVFGRVRGTQTPPIIEEREYKDLLRRVLPG